MVKGKGWAKAPFARHCLAASLEPSKYLSYQFSYACLNYHFLASSMWLVLKDWHVSFFMLYLVFISLLHFLGLTWASLWVLQFLWRFDYFSVISPWLSILLIYHRFYANGRHILSAGQDRAFRLFSVIQVSFNNSKRKNIVVVMDLVTMLVRKYILTWM